MFAWNWPDVLLSFLLTTSALITVWLVYDIWRSTRRPKPPPPRDPKILYDNRWVEEFGSSDLDQLREPSPTE